MFYVHMTYICKFNRILTTNTLPNRSQQGLFEGQQALTTGSFPTAISEDGLVAARFLTAYFSKGPRQIQSGSRSGTLDYAHEAMRFGMLKDCLCCKNSDEM